MTFNVLCSFCDPTFDPWEQRLAYFRDVFERHQPDLIGLQEIAVATEVDDVLTSAPGYEALFFLGTDAYPDATIFFDPERFEVRAEGSFWLSPTPDEPFSIGFAPNRQLPRLVFHATFYDRLAERELTFATTHFDNNPPSQERSAPLVVDRLAAFEPVVFVGDFNSQPGDPAYATLTEAFVDVHDTAAVVDPDQADANRIDHVFIDKTSVWIGERWSADMQKYGPNDLFPSDHRAIAAVLRWND